MNRILPFVSPQPFPLVTHVSRIESDFGPEVVTAIARTWRPEDLARCKLCDQCAARSSDGDVPDPDNRPRVSRIGGDVLHQGPTGRRLAAPEPDVGRRRAGLMNRLLPFLELQPHPRLALVARLDGYTAITRVWNPGEARRCRLCPAGCCTLERAADVCTVLVNESVPTDRALLFDGSDHRWSGPETEGPADAQDN